MPPLAPAIIDDTVEIAGEDVNARKVETRLTTEVRVNGRGPYHFIVDSGADRSVIGANLAERLELPAGKPATLQSLAGPKRVETVMVDRLGLGDTEVSGINAPALSETSLGADGLIGIDAWGLDRPPPAMAADHKKGIPNSLWPTHLVGREREYLQIERLANLDALPPTGFTVVAFPVKIEQGTAGWSRVVALMPD